MADFFLKSGAGAIVLSNRTWSTGEKMVPTLTDASSNVTTGRKWVWECTTGGTSNGTPTWPASATQDVTTVTQNGVVWTARKPGFSSGSTVNWAFSTIYMHYAAAAMAEGDTLYVSDAHAESQSSTTGGGTFPGTAANPNRILCVDDAVTSGFTLTDTATVTTTVTTALQLGGNFYCYGITFTCGTGSTGASLSLSASTSGDETQVYDNCDFQLGSTTATGNRIILGISANPGGRKIVWLNCDAIFGNAGQTFTIISDFTWKGGSIPITSAQVTALFRPSLRAAYIKVSGVDLSRAAAGVDIIQNVSGTNNVDGFLRNCKMPSSYDTTDTSVVPGQRIEVHNCDNGDTNYKIRAGDYTGTMMEEITNVRSGGASDGTTPLAWKIDTRTQAEYPTHLFETPERAIWNESTGSSKTLTVEILHDSVGGGGSGDLTNGEIWLEAQYLGTSGSSKSSFITDAKANVLASAADHTNSSESWTTTGLTTPVKQKLSVTFTPQEKGPILWRVVVAKPSITVYVDPKATIA